LVTRAIGTRVAVQVNDAEDVMFDLYTGNVRHMPHRTALPILVSSSVQGTVLVALALVSFLIATRELPAVPDVLAFVAELPAAAPPPPPPPPRVAQAVPQAARVNPAAAPLEAPTAIAPEPVGAPMNDIAGVEGGVVGGVVGGIPALAEAPPPPPPPPVSHEPVRIGGQVSAPALVKRVEPVYPAIAQLAAIDGIVILDAIVDEHGRIQSVKVLRGHPLLAKAATQAVEQWEYEPLKLNGSPTAFELTVSLWFHFDDKAKKRS
jgi:TonB family protein